MKEDKIIFRWVSGISAFVLIAVIVLNKRILPVPEPVPGWVYTLPMINAFINGTCFCLLCLSFYFIKKKQIQQHKQVNLLTFGLSSIFLVCYILYHWMVKETHYPDDAPFRGLYYFILASHIILAAAVLPLILLSFYFGLKMEVVKHRKLVRFAFPVWLYVTLTGVIVYLMISPYYTFT